MYDMLTNLKKSEEGKRGKEERREMNTNNRNLPSIL
jgi:hypothetical protein